MTQTPINLDDQAARREPVSGAALWHGAWLIAVLIAWGVHYWWVGDDGNRALAVMAVPSAVGLVLAGRRQAWAGSVLVLLWAIAGGLAAAWTGGLNGALGVWCLTPLAAGAVSASRKALPLGATLSAVTAAVVALLQFRGDTATALQGADAAATSLFAFATLGISLGAGLILSTARTRREAWSAQGELHRRADEARFLRALVRAQPQMLLTLDAGGRILDIAGAQIADFKAADLRQDGLSNLVVQRDRERVDLAMAQAGLLPVTEVGFAPAAAPDRWLEASFSRTDSGLLVAAIGDRTAQHDREASLEQARAEADNLNAGKSRFLANMSHELRTPLNAIIGFSDVMRTGMFGALTPKYAEYAGMIHESGGHLLDLINDVLDMSKIEAERFELSREEFDAREAVSAALRLMRLQADEAGVQLRGVLASEPLIVYADRRALKQIVLNLVSNALKFTGKGGQVTVSTRSQGEMLEISVADTGLGISSEDLSRLGRPFEQAGGMQQRTKGTGLGLSLVRAFAELHGGVMGLESTLGEGTAVTVRLPVMLAANGAAPPPEPPPRTPPDPRREPFLASPPAYPSNVVAFDPRR